LALGKKQTTTRTDSQNKIETVANLKLNSGMKLPTFTPQVKKTGKTANLEMKKPPEKRPDMLLAIS